MKRVIALLLAVEIVSVSIFWKNSPTRVLSVSPGSAEVSSPSGTLAEPMEQTVDIRSELNRPEVLKIQLSGSNRILKVTVEATGEGELTKTGMADSALFRLGSDVVKTPVIIRPLETGLELSAGGVKSTVDFPLTFNKATDQLMVDSSDGPRFIRVLPHQALEAAKKVMEGNLEKIAMVETSGGGVGDTLVYKITSQKTGMLLGIFSVSTTTVTSVGVQSGLVIEVKEPFWLRFLSPLII